MAHNIAANYGVTKAFIVMHQSPCGCDELQPLLFWHVNSLTAYLWGKEVNKHTIYSNNKAYIFSNGNLDFIKRVLGAD